MRRFLVLACLLLLISSLSNARSLHKIKAKAPGSGAKRTQVSNPTTAFCKAFNKECYQIAFKGHKGHVEVAHSCHRNGGKYSTSYSFSCKVNGKDKTSTVLNQVGGGYSVTTTKGSTVVVTGTVTDTATSTSTATSEVIDTTTTDVTSTDIQTTVDVDTTLTTTTTTQTNKIPVTATSTTSTTFTTTSTVTDTVTTFTATSFIFGVDSVPVLQVVLPLLTKKRSNKIDNSQFCSAFNTGCTSQCSRVHSTPKHFLCHATSANHYSLTCYCKDGHIETQHALAAALDQEHITTVSTVSTSTSYATVTSTTVVPTTVLSTSVQTITSTIPVTNTYTSMTTTTTTSTATKTSNVPTTVTTAVPTTTITASATTTVTSTVSTTTQIILATSGAVMAELQSDNSNQGYLYQDGPFYYVTTDKASAIEYMAVLDPASGLYQLQVADGSGNAIIAEVGNQGADYSYSSAYAGTYSGSPSLCGTSGTAAGPPEGQGDVFGNACETFVFGISADAETLTDGATIVLESEWVNPGQTIANQYSWLLDVNTPALWSISSLTGFASVYPGFVTPGLVNLRFPA